MIFITGHHNSGKSTAAGCLKEKYGFSHVETGDIVRQLHQHSKTNLPYGEWAKLNSHCFDQVITSTICDLRERILQTNGKVPDIVVTGNRQIEGIRHIINNVQPFPGREHLILYVEADPKILHERHMARMDRPTTRLTFKEFMDGLIKFDQDMGVELIKEHAHIKIRNEETVEKFLMLVSEALRSHGYIL